MKLTRFVFIALFLLVAPLAFSAPLEIEKGDLKLILYPNTGTFNLYQLSEVGKNRYEPLFEDRSNSSTSWFSVSIGKRIFKLEPKAGKPVVCVQNDNGASFVYTLNDDFQVIQNFSFLLDASSGSPYAIKIETAIENTSGKVAPFALKSLIDTNLGESEGIHFFTDLRNRISSEMRFDPTVDRDSIVVSRNKKLSLMFDLYRNGASKPSFVYASNWNRLNTLTWQPEFVEGRSFNTMYTINDSALLFVWPEKELEPNETYTASMIFGPYAKERTKVSAQPPLEITVKAVTDDSSKNGMIERLLERIAQIEANPDSASDEELKQLNDTLDVLLGRKKD